MNNSLIRFLYPLAFILFMGCTTQTITQQTAAVATIALTAVPLPTQAVIAAVNDDPTATIDSSGIPPTWTPAAQVADGHTVFDPNATA
ncbi:MAG: hypothetical protein KDE51_27470, partial [Anaerolineales bacterium]|nr:hypothetical protein [Anaerolineales bacterium]